MPRSAEIVKKYPSLQKQIDGGDDFAEFADGREAKLLQYIYSHPNLDDLRGNPTKILAAIDEFARKEWFLISIGPHKANIISELVSSEKPRVVVELGGYLGYSAILIADQLRRNQSSNESKEVPHIWSLEADPTFAAFAMSLVDLAGLGDIVRVVTGEAEASLRRLHQRGILDHVDLLFLDHVEELYVTDLKVCEELGLLKTGSTIAADNVVRPGAPDYRTYVRQHSGWTSRGVEGLIIPGEYEDEIEISKVE